jgi:tight adherence protein C
MHSVFYLSAFMAFLCGMGLLGSVMLTRTRRATSDRLVEAIDDVSLTERRRSSINQLKHHSLAAAKWLRCTARIFQKADVEEKFLAAGVTSSASKDLYAAIRVVAPVLGAGLGSLFVTRRIFFIALLAGIGYLGPDIVLKRMITVRRARIRLGLPDAIDLLVICVDAGLGIDQAMLRVSHDLEFSHSDLHAEFQMIHREQRAGKPRLEAWQSMAKRTSLVEIDAFVNMLMQTERFGAPIARALSGFADGMRQKRRQRAEELAAKTTVKIMFPLVFFIFPTLFMILIGPAAIDILHALAGTAR